MKLSNKVLIAFFTLIFVYMITAFSEIRFRGTPNILDKTNSTSESVDIPEVYYLIINDISATVSLVPSDNPRLELTSMKGELLKELKYAMLGDTLELAKLELDKNVRANLTVYTSSAFRGFRTNKTTVYVKGLSLSNLDIIQNDGWVHLDAETSITNLSTNVTGNGRLNYAGKRLDLLTAHISNANVTIEQGAKQIEGSMVKDSYLQCFEVDKLNFKKDNTCELYIN